MYYIELLRTQRVMWRYLIVAGGFIVLAALISGLTSHVRTIDDSIHYSAGGHAAIVAFICLLFASIAGSSLSRHLDHVDFALTKPRARAVFAASVLGVDALGLAAFFIATAIVVLALHVVTGETHVLVFDGASWFGIALAFGCVLAWYTIIQAVSCDRGSAGWALAAAWVTAVGLIILGGVSLGPGMDALVAALNLVNPIAYLSNIPFVATGSASFSLVAHAVAIYFVAAAAAAVALIRWQRVEA